ncbi:MAG: NADPH:quinone oxidoreductase family protein [Sphingomonadaceae bacterium]|nr:NADPH:quinone oxidoreductase family protein [Sphingomonadaceae bacterium]
MRALQVRELAPDFAGCSVETVPVPQPQTGEILVRIRASALGFPDLLMTEGGYQFKPDLPSIPGGEGAGEVVALGDGAGDYAVGDEVAVGGLTGGFGEYACYPAAHIRRKPANLSFAQAAAFQSAYLTAYVALVRRGQLTPGEWVLVHGAAGGVGLAAVDLAKALGARVIASSSSNAKLAVVEREYNPDALVNVAGGFREEVKAITGGGADIIYDPIGGDIFDESTRCIAFDGRILVIGFTSGRFATLKTNIALIKCFSVVGVRAGEYGRHHPDKGRENLDIIWSLAEAGRIKPRVHDVLPLTSWRDAFDEMRGRKVVGRVVIDPSR